MDSSGVGSPYIFIVFSIFFFPLKWVGKTPLPVDVMIVPKPSAAFPGPTKSITAWPCIFCQAEYSFTFFRVMSFFLKDVF